MKTQYRKPERTITGATHNVLLPYEAIVNARETDPDGANVVLQCCAGFRRFSKVSRQSNTNVADYAIQTLLDSLLTFRLEPSDPSKSK